MKYYKRNQIVKNKNTEPEVNVSQHDSAIKATLSKCIQYLH